jgi:hypothetical protein
MRAAREGRADRLRERAEEARGEAAAAQKSSDKIAERFYMGQPILVGHHSEAGARRDHERCDNLMRKSIAASGQADDLDRRADAAENNTSIYADAEDPVAEIDAKLEKMRKLRDTMKKANVLVRGILAGKPLESELAELVWSPERAKKLMEPNCFGCYGFESFQLTNLGANIRRLEARRKALAEEKAAPASERVVGDVRVVEDPDLMRIQLVFKGKPDEAKRAVLKSEGFRWAPSVGAWQRQLNSSGRAAAARALARINQVTPPLAADDPLPDSE